MQNILTAMLNKIITVMAILLFAGGAVTGESFTDLTTPPADSIDARLLKIWVPVEGAIFCEVEIDITDSRGDVIRHLLKKRIPQGYYNIYWDKKDDSGAYVPKGEYKYILRSCPRKEIKKLLVRYVKGETMCRIKGGDETKAPFFDFELRGDSLKVSLSILNRTENPVAEVFTDSLMNRGHYQYVWEPDSILNTGQYLFRLKVDDYTNVFWLRYVK